jgi:hypothetical protein
MATDSIHADTAYKNPRPHVELRARTRVRYPQRVRSHARTRNPWIAHTRGHARARKITWATRGSARLVRPSGSRALALALVVARSTR